MRFTTEQKFVTNRFYKDETFIFFYSYFFKIGRGDCTTHFGPKSESNNVTFLLWNQFLSWGYLFNGLQNRSQPNAASILEWNKLNASSIKYSATLPFKYEKFL